MSDDNNLQNYDDDIEITASKKDDLLHFLSGYDVKVYSNTDEGYDYLEEDDLMLVVNNPYCDEEIYIELGWEFTLSFSTWHTHYLATEYGYEKMKKDILKLLNGDMGVVIVDSDRGWHSSCLFNGDASHFKDGKSLLKELSYDKETIKNYVELGVRVRIIYWNPEDTISFDIKKKI